MLASILLDLSVLLIITVASVLLKHILPIVYRFAEFSICFANFSYCWALSSCCSFSVLLTFYLCNAALSFFYSCSLPLFCLFIFQQLQQFFNLHSALSVQLLLLASRRVFLFTINRFEPLFKTLTEHPEIRKRSWTELLWFLQIKGWTAFLT